VLVLNPDGNTANTKRFAFNAAIPKLCIPDMAMSIRDIREEEPNLTAQFLDDALLTIVKRELHLRIEREFPWQDDVDITLTIGGFQADVACKISDLQGFINQTPETDAEYEARVAIPYRFFPSMMSCATLFGAAS